MSTACLRLFAVFHLNLAYSSIEEEQRPEVVRRCYWPLLHLASRYALPLGIEASGYTLESIAAIDTTWLESLRQLTANGTCEFIGSGYVQLAGPLVPAVVNAANLRLGHQVYQRLLGFRPRLALVNEQAYSAGLIQHYLDAGYQAIIMEWDNPARHHPEWDAEWRYLPQRARGQHGESIPLLWNKSIAFQKFQRYAHDEMELEEYLDYLAGHLSTRPRAFPLYGNDVEIFDLRPGRFQTEPILGDQSEWARIERLLVHLANDNRFQMIRPSQVLELMDVPGAGNLLQLETPQAPIPVKKQEKYNITRWAVTGRDDTGINTACWRILRALQAAPSTSDEDWRQLCWLWSSDFRTHITERRWNAYRAQLAAGERDHPIPPSHKSRPPAFSVKDRGSPLMSSSEEQAALNLPASTQVSRHGHYLTVETPCMRVVLNCRRGLAIDALYFKPVSQQWLCGTLRHGYFDDIRWGADYYTGHLVLEAPGCPKVTDLNPVQPYLMHDTDGQAIVVEGEIPTPLGKVRKSIRVAHDACELELWYQLDWPQLPIGSLRLGHVTLNPAAFDAKCLFYRTHNGGCRPETFWLGKTGVDHGDAVSFLVSASHGLGMTEGSFELGDARRVLRIELDHSLAALLGMVTYQPIGSSFFLRLTLSAGEIDDTRRGPAQTCAVPPTYWLRLSAYEDKE